MNLPNYFLADLPPEAELTSVMVSSACDTLKRNREKYLRPRATDDIVKILCEVAVEWLKPENRFRKLALEFGPLQTGFSRPVLEKGLDDFFRRFTPENFDALLKQEFGSTQRLDGFADGALVRAPKLLVHIAAGNLPNPALMSLTLGLLTRSAQFMKCASGASFLPRLFAHSVYEADPKLGTCLELAEWGGGNADLETALFAEADCVTVTGADQTLAAVQSRLPAKARFVGHGQRVSFGFVAREVLREETIAENVSRAADDVVAWDQNGCLSPHCFYVEERGEVESDKFASLLALELMKRETVEPRGEITIEESAAIASRRSLYESLAAHRGDVKLWASRNSTAWTVVFEHEARFHFSPLNRFVFVKPVAELKDVLKGVDEITGKVSTVGIAAPPETFSELAKQFAHWGATRICPLGRMQNPPLTWRHDGRPALGDLIEWTDIEL
jgi:Acyl-CoA reductase (LuxC)